MALAIRARTYAPAILITALAIAIAWVFAAIVLRHTRPMGLPLDDSYIYLTYAKQFGRGEPFTYFPGGGYSAGSTSVLWPMVLAPFWTLGARGHALVWVAYVLCTVFYALTALGVWRAVRRLGGDDLAGVVAAVFLLGIAPFAWCALSGMEVAFASALLIALILLLLDQAPTGAPSKRLGIVLAAASLSRPEATLIVLGVVAIAVGARLRQRDLRAAAWWLAPLAAPLAWLVANKLLAGNFFPNTGVAKSYFYLPGFDTTYWLDAIETTSKALVKGLFWDDASPLVFPRLVAVLYAAGSVRVLVWAHRQQRWLAGLVIVGAPLALLFAVVASSGLWSFQNYRYIAPAFALLAIPVGVALAPLGRRPHLFAAPLAGAAVVGLLLVVAPRAGVPIVAIVAMLLPFALLLPVRWTRALVLALAVALLVPPAVRGLAGDAKLFAQGAADTNTQVVAIGKHVASKLPGARIMFHDAGAIAYYGDGEVYDMLGLVTNHQAGIANHGAGARFELLERLAPDQRPTHFAYYPSWLGTPELYGDVLLQTPLRPRIKGLTKPLLVGDFDMQLIVATFDHVGTGELPLVREPGWRVVDRLDIADLASERAHDWQGALGRRKTGDPTARWSFVERDLEDHGLVLDGGRTIRGGREQFAIATDATKPARLVLRTGGAANVPWHEKIEQPVTLVVYADGARVGELKLPVPQGKLVELALELPPGARTIRTEASGPYRAFHWFVLQR